MGSGFRVRVDEAVETVPKLVIERMESDTVAPCVPVAAACTTKVSVAIGMSRPPSRALSASASPLAGLSTSILSTPVSSVLTVASPHKASCW